MNASSTLWGFYFCVQFPKGKVKLTSHGMSISCPYLFQFPMGKVKRKQETQSVLPRIMFQFPMGKVKLEVHPDILSKIKSVSIPYGKGKGNVT